MGHTLITLRCKMQAKSLTLLSSIVNFLETALKIVFAI